MARAGAALLLLVVAALFFGSAPLLAGARSRGGRHRRLQRQQWLQKLQHPPITLAPADGEGGSSPSSDEAAVRHLFSTPLYVANLSASVDAAALASLALEGYSIVEGSPGVQEDIIALRLLAYENASPEIVAQLNDPTVFTSSDKFFFYQMGNTAKCEHGPARECAGVRWDGFFESTGRRQLEAAIAAAVPRYFATAGVSESEIPPYKIKMWASVMAPGASHTQHEHSSAGVARAAMASSSNTANRPSNFSLS